MTYGEIPNRFLRTNSLERGTPPLSKTIIWTILQKISQNDDNTEWFFLRWEFWITVERELFRTSLNFINLLNFAIMINQVSLVATPSKRLPPPQKCIWSRCNLDLWPLTLKSFPAMPTHVMNIHAKSIEIPPLNTEISRHANKMSLIRQRTAQRKTWSPIVSGGGTVVCGH